MMDKETAFNKTLQLRLESEFAYYLGYVTGFENSEWRKASAKYQGYRNALIDADILTWDDVTQIEKHTVKISKAE